MAQAVEKGNPTERGPLRLAHPSDAEDLRLFYRRGGVEVFYEGYFGQQLERAAMIAYGGASCATCGGTGFVPSNVKAWHRKTAWERHILEVVVGLEPGELDPPLADRVCGKCKGMGWIPRTRRHNAREPLTVQLKGSSKKGKPPPSVRVSDAELALLGRMSARLALLAEWERSVLRDYYGPGGGSIVVLFAYAPAGRTMLRRNSQKLRPREFFENEIKRQEQKPDKQRGSLLEAAGVQAVEVHRAAVGSWIVTRRRVDEVKTTRAALELLDGDGS